MSEGILDTKYRARSNSVIGLRLREGGLRPLPGSCRYWELTGGFVHLLNHRLFSLTPFGVSGLGKPPVLR